MKKLFIVPLLMSSLLISPVVLASNHEDNAEMSSSSHCTCGYKMKMMMESLNLTPEQKEKISSIREKFKTAMKGDMEQLMDLRKQTHMAVTSDVLDEAKVDALSEQKSKIMMKMMKEKMKMKHEIYSVMDASQKQKFHSMMP